MGNLYSRKDVLSQNDFDSFLKWLDPDRERAGYKYEEVRRKLINIFAVRGCAVPEDLADETISRVIHRMGEISDSFTGDPIYYFYGVARNIHLEYIRRSAVPVPDRPDLDNETKEAQDDCLDKCLRSISAENRELVLRYYGAQKGISVQTRRQLAAELGIGLHALRLRTHRIKAALGNCVQECMKTHDR